MNEPTIERYQQAFAYLSQNLGGDVTFDPTADPMLFAEALSADQQGFTGYLVNVMPEEVVALLEFVNADVSPDDDPEELQSELDDLIQGVLELYPDNPWAEEPEEQRLDS